ncbi:hypothetical protein GCM10008171_04370 [Methylopila jiangsuensis]|uniref:Uncharacterized protein n=1 Tax=Methylopila jiangsuensis TaxID=586230 RepID=A0A9W6JF85_9HYPH|nr:hypothetical protein [Methylopila jiangsuensis]MDR6285425.1 hypothetical protein [Methylopila jiangsuensis]GLK75183.1 hypothetical protein GCM10008171_04370 [Methylopila jiangsuensis]
MPETSFDHARVATALTASLVAIFALIALAALAPTGRWTSPPPAFDAPASVSLAR